MDCKEIIRSQYQASIEMLKQAISQCPESLWNSPDDKTPFWHIAYHALFFAHLYLQSTEKDFTPWSKHRAEYQAIGPLPEPPHRMPKIEEPYSKEDLLEYLDICRQQVDEKMEQVDLHSESGFSWLPFSKLELQVYNIRHIQQHTGELMERLGSREKIDVHWVVMKPE